MDVQFGDGFSKSLKRLIWHQNPVYKVWEFFRYKLPHFIKNVWLFRKELYNHRWWDYRFTLEMLYRSLSIMEKDLMEKGHEVDETRIPKVNAIRRALELLKHKMDDDYVERAEAEVGQLIMHDWEYEDTGDGLYRLIDKETDEEKAHNKKVFEVAKELEEIEWKELWEIFKGTKNSKKFGWAYDGTDMRGWWD